MINTKPVSAKRSRILLVLFLFCVSVQAQTIVQVMIDQPEKLEVIITDELYTQTDNALTLGESISVTGGEAPFQYTWFKNDLVIGTGSVVNVQSEFISGLYSLLVTDANNCSVRLIATNINDENTGSAQVSVYPVPASKSITINPNEIPGALDVTFYNSNGSIMMRKEISGETLLDINFPSGLYYIKVENKPGQLIGWRKIVVL